MTVKDLLKAVEYYKGKFGEDVLNYNLYVEVLNPEEIQRKKESGNWGFIKDSEDWEYIECAGFNTVWPEKKMFSINVNY